MLLELRGLDEPRVARDSSVGGVRRIVVGELEEHLLQRRLTEAVLLDVQF